MKNKFIKWFGFALLLATVAGCAESNYPGGEISPYIGIYDVRNLYKGSAVNLNLETLEGSSNLSATVISDHSGGNLPAGMLFVQDARRLGFLRGLAIPVGDIAKDFKPGDSVLINIEGTVLNRVDDILQIQNVTKEKITKVASQRPIYATLTNSAKIAAKPYDYESTLVAIVKGGFEYTPEPGQVISGDQTINDGFGTITVKTEASSSLANLPQYTMANYYGIVFTQTQTDTVLAYQRLRVPSDLVELKSVYKVPKIIITGWNNDPKGSDSNHEYMQFMATEDIDFAQTPFSVVTTNNANASTPTGFPQKGWATGGIRTYKINLTKGTAKKGTLFYVGGSNGLILSTGSTSIKHANWIAAYNYASNDGQGFGTKSANLLANSGNAYGIAVFQGTDVTEKSIPEDVIFVATGGSLVGNGFGYRIANTDFYDIINPITLKEQPFYRSGTNTNNITYNTPSDAGLFNYMGGEYNIKLKRWTKARVKNAYQLQKESTLEEIENPEFTTKLVQ
ncbi:hypothetical protein GCM10022216_11230 [Sphingobacterium kyonggiense]|uniref:DUF5689 domain-containing protein n=1 Tax=Sphingobacterium kyonggiense TaxID=714075 RepID=A0ABP7YHN5_9SPHI